MRSLLHHEVDFLSDDKPWIVWIHGAGGNIRTWKLQRDAFNSQFNSLYVDLRDHGKSKEVQPVYQSYTFDLMVNDVLKVMDCYGIQKAHFVGLSLGSVILQSLAMSYPDRVNRMVLAGGLFSADLLFKAFIHLARFANVFFPYRWMYRVFSWLVMPKKRNQLARKIYQQQAALLSQEEYLKWIGLYPQFFELLQDFYGTLTNYPLLLITGDEDYIFLKGARKFHAIQPKSQLKVLHKCGHICNIERPDEFNRHALDFLLE